MKEDGPNNMLESWRPPTGAGEPIGCLATTFTFDPGLFEEECLSRFLDIDAHPNREDLAFLLERENWLGSVYAGVLVDHRNGGVDHSLRWDVLPVRIPGYCQHAKIALLAWMHHIRVIVSSANLTTSGYRYNREVAAFQEFLPNASDKDQLKSCCSFIKGLLQYVPGSAPDDPVSARAKAFIEQVQKIVNTWKGSATKKKAIKKYFIFTFPETTDPGEGNKVKLGALKSTIDLCIKTGGAPSEVRIVSPFFNQDSEGRDNVVAQICKRMARGIERDVVFCLPSLNTDEENVRLAAPKALYDTAVELADSVTVEVLPRCDSDRNERSWHAKMLWLENDNYIALMTGSSNFTSPGMGLKKKRNNAEANIIHLLKKEAYDRNIGLLRQCWPETEPVENVDDIEWTGICYPLQEEEVSETIPILHEAFLTARYKAGETPTLLLNFANDKLPEEWEIFCGLEHTSKLFDFRQYINQGNTSLVRILWTREEPPRKLLVKWGDKKAFWTINVDNQQDLPLPKEIENMTVNDLMSILSVVDYGAAIRAWARRYSNLSDDDDLDSAIPAELDPLKKFDLHKTFLHRTRKRARMLGRIRKNLERPAWTEKAIQWRLEGIIGIRALAEKLCGELEDQSKNDTETLLEMADFLMMLSEVSYQEASGAISREKFDRAYKGFLKDISEMVANKVRRYPKRISREVQRFLSRAHSLCQR